MIDERKIEISNPMKDLDQLDFEKEDLGDDFTTEEDEVTPFDPKKVDVSISTPNLGTLINRLKHNEIDLMPDFQRSPDLWSKKMQSRLIESILIRLPIPAFYFDAISEDNWQVVDGLQRLSAISNFVLKKKLSLTGLEFLTEYDGCSYDELPRALTRRIDEFETSVYLIKPGTPLEMKYSLFNRINTGGLKLKPQEIRHAMSQSVNKGVASKFLMDIVATSVFEKVVGKKNNRMSYQELVLRHIAFKLIGYETYRSSLPKFLDSAMSLLGNLSDIERDQLHSNFLKVMELAYSLFGVDAFCKSLANPHGNKVVNKPLFEAVSVNLALLNDEDQNTLLRNKVEFKEAFKSLLKDYDFDGAISKSTANTDNVNMRFKMVKDIIQRFLLED